MQLSKGWLLILGIVAALLAIGYAIPPEIRRATNDKLAEFEAEIEAKIDNIPSPSPATWQAIGDPWKE